MNVKKTLAGVAIAGSLVAGGGAAVDKQIDPYTSKTDVYEMVAPAQIVDAGEVKTVLSKDQPAVTLSKWNGEAAMTVIYDKLAGETGSRPLFSNKVEWKGDTEEMHAYPLEAKAGMEDGGFEIEIVLPAAPDTNVFDFAISGAEDMDFLYQAAMNEENPNQECTETECADGSSRPENVVRSYAVYSKEKKNHADGEINYGSGKLFHIYRPKAIDANGVEAWAQLAYNNGTLSVTVPQDFLDTAAYPVTVDPTFGYTTIGGSNDLNSGADTPYTHNEDLSTAGTVDSIVTYGTGTNPSACGTNMKGLIYDDDGASAVPSTLVVVGAPVSLSGCATQAYTSVAASQSLGIGTWYIGYVIQTLGFQAKYDADATRSGYTETGGNSYTTPTNYVTASYIGVHRRSTMYVNYTASGGGAAPADQTYFDEIDN